mmetsp:Transcript_69922/g.214465  ORF Transcript_69922/g.214465 Transcript_69922/m.214465 type:complete len:200 (-) Transcript_69922:74-673(-)
MQARGLRRLSALVRAVSGSPVKSVPSVSSSALPVPRLSSELSVSFSPAAGAWDTAVGARLYSAQACASPPDGEVERAAAAAQAGEDTAPRTVFDRVLASNQDWVHQDDLCVAFNDINPQAPVHILVIPRDRDGLTQMSKARQDQAGILGHLMMVASRLGASKCPQGFRIVVNDGKEGAQSVYHLHVHVLGGRQMGWPPG